MTSFQHISIEKKAVFHIDNVTEALTTLIEEHKSTLRSSITSPTLVSFTLNLHSFNILSSFHFNSNQPCTIYWSDREDKNEVLAFGDVDRLSGDGYFDYQDVISSLYSRLENLSGDTRYYGGFKFNHTTPADNIWNGFGSYQFILPHLEVRKSPEGTVFISHMLLHSASYLDKKADFTLNSLKNLFLTASSDQTQPLPVMNRTDVPNYDQWKQMINESLDVFKDTPLEKIVLARKTSLQYPEPIDPVSLLKHLKSVVVNAFHFYIKFKHSLGFIGASPERLYKREGDMVYTEAIAGTRLRGKTHDEDQLLANELLTSDKDVREHDFVCESIKTTLNSTCSSVALQKKRNILKLARVQHLHSKYTALLKPEHSEATLLGRLHPTPAVGGVPKTEALCKIADLEPFDRGWYAAPIGWISRENSEFAVAIRSGLIDGSNLHAFTGAGIVEGSNPKEEWEEIENKLGSFFVTPSLNGHAECKT